jgi:tetrahydrodipicolinate N-succinyltransferase
MSSAPSSPTLPRVQDVVQPTRQDIRDKLTTAFLEWDSVVHSLLEGADPNQVHIHESTHNKTLKENDKRENEILENRKIRFTLMYIKSYFSIS